MSVPVGDGKGERAARAARSDPTRAEILRLAYDEGKRTIDDQLSELDSMRQRTVQFLAFIGSATAFLVGAGISGSNRPSLFFIIAILATVMSIFCIALSQAILTSKTKYFRHGVDKWSLRLEPGKLKLWAEGDLPPSEEHLYSALIDVYDKMIGNNRPLLIKTRRRYQLFLGTGFVQLCLWVVLMWLFA